VPAHRARTAFFILTPIANKLLRLTPPLSFGFIQQPLIDKILGVKVFLQPSKHPKPSKPISVPSKREAAKTLAEAFC
jgi:hypothetical protein